MSLLLLVPVVDLYLPRAGALYLDSACQQPPRTGLRLLYPDPFLFTDQHLYFLDQPNHKIIDFDILSKYAEHDNLCGASLPRLPQCGRSPGLWSMSLARVLQNRSLTKRSFPVSQTSAAPLARKPNGVVCAAMNNTCNV